MLVRHPAGRSGYGSTACSLPRGLPGSRGGRSPALAQPALPGGDGPVGARTRPPSIGRWRDEQHGFDSLRCRRYCHRTGFFRSQPRMGLPAGQAPLRSGHLGGVAGGLESFRVLEAVVQWPGFHLRLLKAVCRESPDQNRVRAALQQLVRSGRVLRLGEGRTARYFATGSGLGLRAGEDRVVPVAGSHAENIEAHSLEASRGWPEGIAPVLPGRGLPRGQRRQVHGAPRCRGRLRS